MHALYVSRLVHRVVTSYYKQRSIIGGVVKCLLMDCYCACAGFSYVFVQICYFANWDKCTRGGAKEADPGKFLELTTQWLWWEVIYQYSQIGLWIVENLLIVCIIIIQQKRYRRRLESKCDRY